MFTQLGLSEDTLTDLKNTIARRLTPKPVKVRADVEVKCFAYAGIEAIRKALQAGEDASTEAVKINVRLVAPPLYVMTTTSTDKVQAIEVMEKAVEIIGDVISKEGGDLTVKMKVSRDVKGCANGSRKWSARRKMQSSKLSWSSLNRQIWMLRVMTIRRRRISERHGIEVRWATSTTSCMGISRPTVIDLCNIIQQGYFPSERFFYILRP